MSLPTIFISYSHADEAWKDRVVSHLKVLEELAVWDDREIDAGDEWWPAIDAALTKAMVAVLLISTDFLNSEFIRHHEVPALLRRWSSNGVRVIPLLVRPCVWDGFDWLAALQMRPKDARPLSAGTEHEVETDLAALAKEIRQLLRGASGGHGSPQIWTVPYRRNPYFVGREEILEQLRELLTQDGAAASARPRPSVASAGSGRHRPPSSTPIDTATSTGRCSSCALTPRPRS